MSTPTPPADYDSPWKEAIEQYFAPFLAFFFPVVQIRDTGRDWATLEQDPNPFAMVVMAHLKAREVRDGAERKQWKL